jgi:hypothetical protein
MFCFNSVITSDNHIRFNIFNNFAIKAGEILNLELTDIGAKSPVSCYIKHKQINVLQFLLVSTHIQIVPIFLPLKKLSINSSD